MVITWFELGDRLQRYFAFAKKEKRDILIATLIIGFIFSFRDWGTGDSVDIVTGVTNLIITIIIVAIALVIHESAHRFFALSIGYKSEFKPWYGGLIVSLILVIVSNGRVQLALPGGMVNAVMARHRLGEFRYGLNYWENGIIALYGPLFNLLLAFIAKVFLYFAPQSWILDKFLFVNILFAICTMLPIPPLDGMSVFFASRVLYVLSFIGILVSSVLIYFAGIWLALAGGILAIIIGTTMYYLKVEA